MTFTKLNSSLSGIAVAIAASTALLSTASTIVVKGAGRATPLSDAVTCDMSHYRASPGFTVSMDQHVLTVAWNGQNGSEMRTRYAIEDGQPIVRELAVRKAGGTWVALGQNLTPEYHFVSGIRRMSTQQADPLKAAG